MTRYFHLYSFIAVSLGIACRKYPDLVLDIIDQWLAQSAENRPGWVDNRILTRREMNLATAVLTYAEIRYTKDVDASKSNEILTPAWAFQSIRAILEEERHPFVRENALVAISRLARLYFEDIDDEFQALVQKLTPEEHRKIVDLLTDMYLEQRRSQPGSDELISVDGQTYPVWIDSERPKTAIEIAMYNWSRHASNSTAIQLAYQAESAFRNVLEREEEKCINELKEAREKEKEAEKREVTRPPAKISFETQKLSFFTDRIAVPLATLHESSQVRQVIKAVLPKALGQNKAERQEMLEKYKNDGREEIAGALIKAIRWSKREPLVYFVCFISLFILLIALAALYTYNYNNPLFHELVESLRSAFFGA